MSIYRVIDKLETYIRKGVWLPFGFRIVNEERFIELVEKLRSTLPEEMGRAKVISSNKERVLRDAQERAQQIVTEATNTHAQLVDQSELVRRSRETANTLLRDAQERARVIREGADSYAKRVLADLEHRLGSALTSVKKGKETLDTQAQAAAVQPLVEAEAIEHKPSTTRSRRLAFDDSRESIIRDHVEA